ncbi:T9SS type A sorting domain-containing protein [candidate division GN15 bacterium]|nr:T9SS type A sorting domain-containing protein [candidate division GN15 bacterium]
MNPLELIRSTYCIDSLKDSATTSSSATSIQAAYDCSANKLSSFRSVANELDIPFWVYLQTGRQCGKDDFGNTVCGRRDPTFNEMQVQAYLALLYDASGIGYFTGGTLYFDDSVYSAAGMDYKLHTSVAAMEEGKGVDDDNIRNGGLVEWDADLDKYVPTERWHAAREVHTVIDSIWPTLEPLDWEGGADWEDVTMLAGSIDSVASTTFTADSTYLHLSRFSSAADDEYYLLLNRRSLSSDSQTVSFYFADNPGLVRMTDQYTGEVFQSYDSAGFTEVQIPFDPAQLRFVKTEYISQFMGSWSGTWPRFATINIVGDIVVDSGYTLTIQTDSIPVLNNADSALGGADTALVEIVVNGELRIDGSTNRVKLGANCDVGGWFGIRSIDSGGSSGKVYINNALIKNAYSGVRSLTESPDTIINSRFEKCEMDCIYTESDSAYIALDTFYCDSSWNCDQFEHGIKAVSASVKIEDCYFETIEKPIYGDKAHLDMDECVVYLKPGNPFGSTTGIYLTGPGSGIITNTDVWNHREAITLGSSLDTVIIDGCAFDSDTGNYDFMTHYGIRASGSGTVARVRDNCFIRVISRAISNDETARSLFDLGTASDSGNNVVIHDYLYMLHGLVPQYGPAVAVYGPSGKGGSSDTLRAQYNGWDTVGVPGSGGLPGDWFPGLVDTSNGRLTAYVRCHALEYVPPELDSALKVLPTEFTVSQNYPNPFNAGTVISFVIPTASSVRIDVFNILGQRVETIYDQWLPPGEHVLWWDGRSGQGEEVASGVYFYRVVAGEESITKKMLLIK